MPNFEKFLEEELKIKNIPYSEREVSALSEIYAMLCDYNEKVNLTAVTEPAAAAKKHFADSLLAFSAGIFKAGDRVVDVGTGAGFPGLPLAVFLPDVSFTLIDSLAKKLAFTDSVKSMLGLENLVTQTVRAEEFGQGENREKFDVAVSRAVANLTVLSELCLPLVKVGGVFAAYKSQEAQNEIAEAKFAIATLGGEIEKIFGDEERNLVIIRKVSPTPEKYPRRVGVPTKKPLKT